MSTPSAQGNNTVYLDIRTPQLLLNKGMSMVYSQFFVTIFKPYKNWVEIWAFELFLSVRGLRAAIMHGIWNSTTVKHTFHALFSEVIYMNLLF